LAEKHIMQAETIEEVQEIVRRKMDSTLNNLRQEFNNIHAGRVTPAMLENEKIDYYGSLTPITQVASVSAPEPQLLMINPWEKNMIKQIERTLQAANLGFSLSNDGNVIRALLPPFTEERRKERVKQTKKIGEEVKVALRNVRREGNDTLKKMEKDKLISQDEEKGAQAVIQKLTDEHINLVSELMTAKEKELMTI
ncbi:MAG: ribosome recycling factor, partial [SAR324 cluster bacterium]|nr:ribosome recycling factor [SAR324 cluster bacterium]